MAEAPLTAAFSKQQGALAGEDLHLCACKWRLCRLCCGGCAASAAAAWPTGRSAASHLHAR